MNYSVQEQLHSMDRDDGMGVINYSMLVALVGQQAAKGEAGRLYQKDGIELNEITELCIEFLRIRTIDNLWSLTNLVKLSLPHNLITKINNLDALVKLEELDLSFNHISVMENLDHLTELKILLLAGNEISVIENIDNLKKLSIFSIADNRLDEWKHVVYLRRFNNLHSVNITGNPCTHQHNYNDYFIALLPQVLYFCYVMIDEKKRAAATAKYRRDITKVEDTEAKTKRELIEKDEFERKNVMDTRAFVENMANDELFKLLFQHDKDGIVLSNINDATIAALAEYRVNFTKISREIYEFGMGQYHQRMREIEIFSNVVQEARDIVRDKARQKNRTTLKRTDEMFVTFSSEIDKESKKEKSDQQTEPFHFAIDVKHSKFNNFKDEFEGFLSTTWTQLIYNEIVLYEQIEDITESFKINTANIKDSFVEFIRAAFARMRNVVLQYRDAINEIVNVYINNIGEEFILPSHLLNVCGDVDILNNTLALSQNVHLQIIDVREDNIIQRINFWYVDLVQQLEKKERAKHRQRILEISHFLQYQREQLANHLYANDFLAATFEN